MTPWIIGILLGAFALHYAVETGLQVLNLRHVRRHGGGVPPALEGHIAPESAAQAQSYTLAKGRLALASGAWDTALTLLVLFSGLLPALDAGLAAAGLAGAHHFVVFLVLLTAVFSLGRLPWTLYATFGIETRFGFNRTSWLLWLLDRAKGLLIAALLGLPVLYATYAFMVGTGAAWWLWLFVFYTALQLVMVWLYPALIAPLFNRFTPLPEGSLSAQVRALAERAGFRSRGIYVMDASRRSGHGNAYCTGFLRPRIVLFDTLLKESPEEEALAVLAHEIGHYRLRHIHRRLAAGLLSSLAGLWLLSLLIDWPPLFAAFGFGETSYHVALALFSLLSGAFLFPLTPLFAWRSRAHEYEADAYAARLTGAPQTLRSALVRLMEDNLGNLHPHPWYSAYHYSHPTLLERLAALGELTALGEAGESGQSAAT